MRNIKCALRPGKTVQNSNSQKSTTCSPWWLSSPMSPSICSSSIMSLTATTRTTLPKLNSSNRLTLAWLKRELMKSSSNSTLKTFTSLTSENFNSKRKNKKSQFKFCPNSCLNLKYGLINRLECWPNFKKNVSISLIKNTWHRGKMK